MAILGELHWIAPQMTLNDTRWKISHVCYKVSHVPVSQLSVCFSLLPIVFKLLEGNNHFQTRALKMLNDLQIMKMTLNNMNNMGPRNPINHLLVHSVTQILIRFIVHVVRPPVFKLHAILRHKDAKWPKISFEHYEDKGIPYVLCWYPQVPTSISFSVQIAFFELQTILRCVHCMSQNGLKDYTLKGTPYTIYVLRAAQCASARAWVRMY